jgi:hypothetical protein
LQAPNRVGDRVSRIQHLFESSLLHLLKSHQGCGVTAASVSRELGDFSAPFTKLLNRIRRTLANSCAHDQTRNSLLHSIQSR